MHASSPLSLRTMLFALMLFSAKGHAALLDLSESPLFLSGDIKPNVFFILDDSGSMDWEILTNQHWHFCAYDPYSNGSFQSNDCGWWITEGLLRGYSGGYRWFEYIYENSDNAYTDDCAGTNRNSVEACPTVGDLDWRVFSSDNNVVYYNPNTTYTPWVGDCLTDGTDCSDATFTSVRSDPKQGSDGYTVTRDLSGFEYHVWVDDKGFSGSRPQKGTNNNSTNSPNGGIDIWDSHLKVEINSIDAKIYLVAYAPNTSDINETETLLATLNDVSACYNALGSISLARDVATSVLTPDSTSSAGCRTLAQARQNTANWYQFYRKRSLASKNVIGLVLNDFPDFRYGISVINNETSLFVEMPATGADIPTHNNALLNSLYGFDWPAAGTPLRQGLEMVGKYYDGTLSAHPTSPITQSCQQNFSLMLTDGLWNGSSPTTGNYDADGDGHSGTISDVAKHFYATDLSTLENNVPSNPFDPATYQHMVSFMIAFGVQGSLVDTDGDGWPNPALAESGNWGDAFSSDAAKVDDLWHGAFNSKGFYTSAQTPEDISTQLFSALRNITERISSSASVAQNSSTLQTNSKVYQARFHSASWKGELLAYAIDLNGDIASTPSWNASCALTGGDCDLPTIPAASNPGITPNNRVILTRNYDGTQSGIAFRFPSDYTTYLNAGSLPDSLSGLMQYAPFAQATTVPAEISANQNYGQALVDYLRGVRTNEVQNAGTYQFRDRTSILGDIIHSDPLFVDEPIRFYPDNLESAPYSTFKSTYQGRQKMIYTGANDGMLHGFNADTGAELIAYVPGMRTIYEKLPELSKTTYNHLTFVDGSPTENDVFINGAWKSILTGALRKGGQGIYALDITDPSQFTEANAANLFLFEFTDEDDPDVGYIYGRVNLAKVRSGPGTSRWAAIFGNGYNNSEADGFASTTGQAVLYILYLDEIADGVWGGGDFVKINVGPTDVTTPNGLASPYVVDIDGDYIVDYIYAGDLKGNFWKFNLTDTNPANWAANTSLFFQTPSGNQPITSQAVVGPHPTGLNNGVMIYFGTGRYIDTSDNTPVGAITQSFYGLWDKLDGTTPTQSDLLTQSIITEVSQDVDTDGDGTDDTTIEFRQVSSNAINWTAPSAPGDPAQHLGWHMDLIVSGVNNGERSIFQPILRNNNIIFTTILPSQSQCDFGGDSWLMELDAQNGGQANETPFDVNQDGYFTSADYILVPDIDGDGQDDYVPAGGQKSSVGITPTPAVFMTENKDKEVKVLSGSTGLDTITENPGSGPGGRQNWRHLP